MHACSVEGCTSAHHARDLCKSHYNATRDRKKFRLPCRVHGCLIIPRTGIYCRDHKRARQVA